MTGCMLGWVRLSKVIQNFPPNPIPCYIWDTKPSFYLPVYAWNSWLCQCPPLGSSEEHSPTNMHLIRGQSSERHIGSGGTVSVFPDYLSSAAALQVILDSTHCWCHGLNQQLLLLSDILPNSGSHAKRERERGSATVEIKDLSCLGKLSVETEEGEVGGKH